MNQIKKYLPQTNFISSTVAFLVKDDQVLLGLRKKVSHGLGDQLISGIGGKVDPGEKDDEAIKRELSEEIKINTVRFKLHGRIKFIFPDKPKWSHSVAVYIVEEWDGDPTETDEIKPIWFPKNELPHPNMWADSKLWIPLVLSGKKIDGIVLYGPDGTVQEHIIEEITDNEV